MNPHIKKTKKDTIAHYRIMLKTNTGWAVRGLLRIFEFQTEEEQNREATTEHNGVGFTAFDAEILSSYAKQFQERHWLSDKQLVILHKRMPKYANQLYRISLVVQEDDQQALL